MNKSEKRNKRNLERDLARIPAKPPFKRDVQLDVNFPSGDTDWTGATEKLPQLAPWPTHDVTKKESDTTDHSGMPDRSSPTTGRSWPDMVHGLLIGENIEVLFCLLLLVAFGLDYWWDGRTGQWNSFDTFLLSVRKVVAVGGVLAVFYVVIKVILWFRRK